MEVMRLISACRAAQVMPALSAKPPSTAVKEDEWGWGKYIERSLLFLLFHILGGPRFAFNMWHASKPLSSHAWQQFIPLSNENNTYAVQVRVCAVSDCVHLFVWAWVCPFVCA